MTRPSELYSDLINNGITKSNFLSHIKKTDIYQNLKYMENFDKDKFISSIDMNNKEIKEIVKISGVENNPKALLEFMVERMKDLIIDFVIEQNYDNLFFESVFHPEKIKKDVKNIEKRFKMFKNSEKFLDFIEKRFKFVANDTLRKISKTWDLLKNDKNSDIMDKINKKTSSEVKNENQWINQKALKYINTFDVKNWMPSKKGNGGNGDNQIL
jgi:hypothetical protein